MKKIFLLMLLFASIVSCEKDDNGGQTPPVDPTDPVELIVLNEGKIGSGMGTISTLTQSGKMTYDIFKDVNNRPMGDVAQCVAYINGNYYVTLNNSHKVEVVDPISFASVATIDFGDEDVNPRFIVRISDTEAIVSAMRPFLYRINTQTFKVVETIDIKSVTGNINWGIEKMAVVDGKLFGATLNRKGVAVFDLNNISAENCRLIADVQPGENSKTCKMLVDKNGKLWVATHQAGKMFTLNCIDPATETLIKKVEYPVIASTDTENYVVGAIVGSEYYPRTDMDRNKDKIYFTMRALTDVDRGSDVLAIYSYNIDTEETTIFRSCIGVGMMYGMGVSPDGKIGYICDCLDYSAQRGYLRGFKEDESVVSYRVGIYPRMIYFTEYNE